MIKSMTILLVAGARPNFMKIAPIYFALESKKTFMRSKNIELRIVIVHTGQHYDVNMSDIFFRDLEIPKPDIYLGTGSGSHAEQTGKIMIAFEKVLLDTQPDWVIVVGDVNSTVACSLTSKKLGVKVAHVEAGLRSFDMTMPEEVNRKVTDSICDLLFVTEESGITNLRNEGIPTKQIFHVGNVMIDSLLKNLAKMEKNGFQPSPAIKEFIIKHNKYAVLTLHRPSNVDSPEHFFPIWEAIRQVSQKIPILFPAHPRTLSKINKNEGNNGNIMITEPLGYHDMLFAIKNSKIVITDSGGLQEETTALGIHCVTIRENTERPITVEIGTNYLIGTKFDMIVSTVENIIAGKGKNGIVPPLWDGRAAERIVDILISQ